MCQPATCLRLSSQAHKINTSEINVNTFKPFPTFTDFWSHVIIIHCLCQLRLAFWWKVWVKNSLDLLHTLLWKLCQPFRKLVKLSIGSRSLQGNLSIKVDCQGSCFVERALKSSPTLAPQPLDINECLQNCDRKGCLPSKAHFYLSRHVWKGFFFHCFNLLVCCSRNWIFHWNSSVRCAFVATCTNIIRETGGRGAKRRDSLCFVHPITTSSMMR